MIMKRAIVFSFLLINIFFFFNIPPTNAHQPNYVANQTVVEIIDPEISKAYYGELDGEKVSYKINSESDFDLYLGVLVPDIKGISKDYSAVVFDSKNNQVAFLDGGNFEWSRFYEEFAGDWYWKGPEFKQRVASGSYTVEISNIKNIGKYILTVGEIESFPINKTIETFSQLIKVKEHSFNKPWYSAFLNKVALFTFGPLFIFAIILFLIFLSFRKNKRLK